MGEYIYHSEGAPMKNAAGKIIWPREEIVRCRDCKHSYLFDMSWKSPKSNDKRYCKYGSYLQYEVQDDGFCAWGERGERRTVEDVLSDLVNSVGTVEFDALTAIREAAAEIRGLLGVN